MFKIFKIKKEINLIGKNVERFRYNACDSYKCNLFGIVSVFECNNIRIHFHSRNNGVSLFIQHSIINSTLINLNFREKILLRKSFKKKIIESRKEVTKRLSEEELILKQIKFETK